MLIYVFFDTLRSNLTSKNSDDIEDGVEVIFLSVIMDLVHIGHRN